MRQLMLLLLLLLQLLKLLLDLLLLLQLLQLGDDLLLLLKLKELAAGVGGVGRHCLLSGCCRRRLLQSQHVQSLSSEPWCRAQHPEGSREERIGRRCGCR